MVQELNIVSVSVPKAGVDNGIAFYTVNVSATFNSWSVVKRYSQFEEMHNELAADFATRNKCTKTNASCCFHPSLTCHGLRCAVLPKNVALPPKELKLLQSHLSAAFIEKRRYSLVIVVSYDCCTSDFLRDFSDIDRVLLENYVRKLLQHKETSKSPIVIRFLTSDKRDYVEVGC